MVEKSKVACFSGHRRLPPNCEELKANLKKEIIRSDRARGCVLWRGWGLGL